jgi:predicted metal-dependent HD superfamily phosphohydrolase
MLGTDQSLIFQTVAKYSEPWRKFHTMEHLAHLWAQYERACALTNRYWRYLDGMEILIPFHDWVYIPGSQTNEIESAEHAAYWLTSIRPPGAGVKARPNLDQVPRIILGTQHHQEPLTDMEALFFDMDLSGLGLPYDQYVRTSGQVMEEFCQFVKLRDYLAGRADWIRGMLRRPRIFNLPEFERFEQPARDNLEAELSGLG